MVVIHLSPTYPFRLRGTASYQIRSGFKSLYLDGRAGYADIPAIDFRKSSFSIAIRFNVQDVHTLGHLFSDWSSPFQFRVYVFVEHVYVHLRRPGDVLDLLHMGSTGLVQGLQLSTVLFEMITFPHCKKNNEQRHRVKKVD